MKLHLDRAEGRNLFSGYGAGYVAVNRARYETSLVVTPDAVLAWRVQAFEALRVADFEPVFAQRPELVVLGTGARQRLPGAEIARAFAERNVGLEAMDTRAACRTYNILAAEGRRVVAAILLP